MKKRDKYSSGSELINGRSMMTVTEMYAKPDEVMPKLISSFVDEYSDYPDRLKECLTSGVDELVEGLQSRGQEVDDQKVKLIRKEISLALKGEVCQKKKVNKKKPSMPVSEDFEPSPPNSSASQE